MRITPISNNSINFKGVSIEAIDRYLVQHQNEPEKLKEFTNTVIKESRDTNYNITFVQSLGLYAVVGKRIKRGFEDMELRPTHTFNQALKLKNGHEYDEFEDDSVYVSRKQFKQEVKDRKEAFEVISVYTTTDDVRERASAKAKIMSVLYKYGI